MSHLTEQQLLELTVLLKDEKRQINHHFEQNDNQEASASQSASAGTDGQELSAYDNHPGDLGTETFERERDMAIDQHMAEQREEIESALQRIKDGQYGTCEICGSDIPYERLQAFPAAPRCIEHASDNLSEARPVEEELLVVQRDPAHFDDANAWQAVEDYGNASRTVKPGQ